MAAGDAYNSESVCSLEMVFTKHENKTLTTTDHEWRTHCWFRAASRQRKCHLFHLHTHPSRCLFMMNFQCWKCSTVAISNCFSACIQLNSSYYIANMLEWSRGSNLWATKWELWKFCYAKILYIGMIEVSWVPSELAAMHACGVRLPLTNAMAKFHFNK